MIPLIKEPAEYFDDFHVYEDCCFCGNKTKYWHLQTNKPICKECAKKHKVSDIQKTNK